MKQLILTLAFVIALLLVPAAAQAGNGNGNGNGNKCWGQATSVFARMGAMGEHSSSFPTPRLGLRNLDRLLADSGAIPDDSMASLGQFVVADLGLSIDACMD